MTTVTERPRTTPASAAQDRGPGDGLPPDPDANAQAGDGAAFAAVAALVLTACLPLTEVYVGTAFLRPVLAAALLALGCAWASRRAGLGPLGSLGVSAAGWALLMAFAFLPDTLLAGVVPTLETLAAGRELWLEGIELLRIRPAPAFPEAGLLLVTASGVWWIAHAIEGLVFRLEAPLRACALAVLLWAVPLAIAPPRARAWSWAVPLLAAGAGVLLATGVQHLRRWAPGPPAGAGQDSGRRLATGWPLALTAIVAGAVLASTLPGFGQPPWYEVQNLGSTTLTTNPIVSIRSNLVTLSQQPVARVVSPRPVYLRLTSLDVYSEREEWTSEGIRGSPVSGRLPTETALPFATEASVTVEVADLPGALIVPAPYHPVAVEPPADTPFLYDVSQATLTVDRDASLDTGEAYTVTAAIPDPPPEALDVANLSQAPAALTALPSNIPAEVGQTARDIVEAAGARTAFEQAIALQEELRSWTYSLEPPQGHGANAMVAFLASRTGYCEQFAGTMAVMLRTLGIPARVAVGFTPGTLVDPAANLWEVRNANAHAWVEVLFPGLGWLAFEPTPREDGNLLTPTPGTLAPAITDAQRAGQAPLPGEQQLPEEPGGQELPGPDQDLVPDIDELERDRQQAAGGQDGGSGVTRWLIAAFAVLLAVGAGVLLRGRQTREELAPAEAVLAELGRVRRTGRGLGVPPQPSETEHEYLHRLARQVPEADAHARTLAQTAARARYAPVVAGTDAETAAAAAAGLCDALLADWSRLRRAGIGARGWSTERVEAARRALTARLNARGDTTDPDQDETSTGRALRRLTHRRNRP